jgi:hypothetical protein
VKIISKTIFPLFLAVILSSCNGKVAAIPTMSQVNIMGTAMSVAKTEVVMTMTAVPTATYPSPTLIPPESTRIPPETYSEKIDYVMVTAPKIYKLLPYINKYLPTGEYTGCIDTYDFHDYVSYTILLPMDTVNTAFLNYFSTEKWGFTEATLGKIGSPDNGIPTIRYDVYRITSKELPAFERLQVYLEDQSFLPGKNRIYVRAELTHIETKENISNLSNFDCLNSASWHLYSLYR